MGSREQRPPVYELRSALPFVASWAVPAVIGVFAPTASAIVPGEENTVDSATSTVFVTDGPTQTIVHIISPADISNFRAFDASKTDMAGGHISGARFNDSSTFEFNGGDISHLETHDSSHADLRQGTIGHVRAYQHSTINVFGGSFDFVTAEGEDNAGAPSTSPASHVVIYGGHVGVAKTDTGSIDILGGDVSAVYPVHGIMNVFGGTVHEFVLNAGTATSVYGTGFGLVFMDTVADMPQFHLTGVLQDGSLLDATVLLATGAQLNLVPETTAVPLLSAVSMLVMCARRSGPLHARR